jgi:hypothetical protein
VTKMQPILNASMMKFYEGPLSRSSSGGLAWLLHPTPLTSRK